MHPKKFLFGNTSDSGRLYLYKYGDECINVTGGIDITYNNNCTLTKESDHLHWVNASSGIMQYSVIHTHNKLSLDGTYHAVHIDFEDYITISNVSYFGGGMNQTNDTRPYNDSNLIRLGGTSSGIGGTYFKNSRFTDISWYDANYEYDNSSAVDLKTVIGEYYFYLHHYSDYSQTGYANIYAIWLE